MRAMRSDFLGIFGGLEEGGGMVKLPGTRMSSS